MMQPAYALGELQEPGIVLRVCLVSDKTLPKMEHFMSHQSDKGI
jgi:hypothetical protein